MAAVFTKEALRGQHRDLRLSHRLPQRLIGGARRIQQPDPNLIVSETGVGPKL
jgi:hypothetical protein